MISCYIGLGSNLGDRLSNLQAALQNLARLGVAILQQSCVYQSSPVDCQTEQPMYLNMVVKAQVLVTPVELVRLAQKIEYDLGRRRTKINAAREIDIDLLLYGEQVSQVEEAIVPHPRMWQRLFVMAPLRQIAKELYIPTNNASVEQLFVECLQATTEDVRLYGPTFDLS